MARLLAKNIIFEYLEEFDDLYGKGCAHCTVSLHHAIPAISMRTIQRVIKELIKEDKITINHVLSKNNINYYEVVY